MADEVAELRVLITGDAASLQAAVAGVEKQLAGLGGAKGFQNLSATSQKALSTMTAGTLKYRDVVNNAKKTLDDKRETLTKTKEAYNSNTKVIKDNISTLKNQQSSVKNLISTKKDELTALEKANGGLKRGSTAYKENTASIKSAKSELKQLSREYRGTENDIAKQQSALKNEISTRREARRAVTEAGKSYNELNANLAAVEKMERALQWQEKGKTMKEFAGSVDAAAKPLYTTYLALASGGVAAAKFAVDFEDNFANVKKTVEGTPEQLEAVKQGIIDLTTTGINGRNAIPQTTAQLTELAAAGGQLGIQTDNIVDFTETMAQMGTATNLAGAEGAAALARFMNVTNTSQEQVKNLGSAVVDLGNNFATSESEIANLALRMGATGNVVGISAQDILGYSTALSSMGIEAEAGGSAVSRIWMEIQSAVSSGGESLSTFSKVSGKSSAEFAEQWKTDASGAFKTFLDGLSKSADQVKTLEELGFNNIRDIQALQRLASDKGIQLVTEALSRSNKAWTENIALQKEADAKAETTAGQIQIMKNNFAEAARSIGETFLPSIVDGSAGLKDFAQSIAKMDDAQKQGLITIGKWVIGLGAGLKVTTSVAKGVGGVVEAFGKLKGAAVAVKGVSALATAGEGLAAVAPALGSAVSWFAVPAAMSIGMQKYGEYLREARQEFLESGKAAENLAQESKGIFDNTKQIEKYTTRLAELDKIITSSNKTPEGLEAANAALEERKQITQWFIDNYGEYLSLQDRENGVSTDTANSIKELTAAELEYKKAELQSTITDAASNVPTLEKSIAYYKKQKDALLENNTELTKNMTTIKQAQSEFDNLLNNRGSMSTREFSTQWDALEEKYKSADEAFKNLTGLDKSIFSYKNMGEVIDILSGKLDENKGKINQYDTDIGTASDSLSGYNSAAHMFAGILASEMPNAVKQGDAAVQQVIQGIGEAVQAVGMSANEAGQYANSTALQMHGFSTATEAASAGPQKMSETVTSCMDNMIKWGYSANQAAVQGALLEQGFNNVSEAGEHLDSVSKRATELGRVIGEIDGEHHIQISAQGDISIVENATGAVKELQTVGGATVTVTGDGNIDIIDEAGNQVTYLQGAGNVSLQVNADGNIDVLNEAGEVVNTIPKEVVQNVNVNADLDTSEVDNYQPEDKEATAKYSVNSEAVDNWSAPEKQGTVVYKAVIEEARANARGTDNFKGGLARINDQRGIKDPRELVEINDEQYLFEGRDVILPLPEHAKVYTAPQTQAILSQMGIKSYASGKNNEAWETSKSDRQHYRKASYSIIPATEELEWLEEMKKQFADDAEVIKEITEEIVSYTREAWQESLDNMKFALDMGWTSAEEYYSNLAAYRDENFAHDTEEWRDATLELHKYAQDLVKDANEVSRAWIAERNALNDWGAFGDSAVEAYNRVDEANKKAAAEGTMTQKEYNETMKELGSDMLSDRMSASYDWISHEAKYNNLSLEEQRAGYERMADYIQEYYSKGLISYAEMVEGMGKVNDHIKDVGFSEFDRWQSDADLYQRQSEAYGWDWLHDDSEVDFYQRKINEAAKFYNKGKISQEDYNRFIAETQMELYKAQEEEYDEMLDNMRESIDKVKDKFSEQEQALRDSWNVEDRKQDKAQVQADMEKYKNAVTKEGQDKYKELQEQLKQIEREEELYNLQQENNAVIKQMEAEYAELEVQKTEILRQNLEADFALTDKISEWTTNVTKSADNNADKIVKGIDAAVQKIKPSITVNQRNEFVVSDMTDGVLVSNKVIDGILGVAKQ